MDVYIYAYMYKFKYICIGFVVFHKIITKYDVTTIIPRDMERVRGNYAALYCVQPKAPATELNSPVLRPTLPLSLLPSL